MLVVRRRLGVGGFHETPGSLIIKAGCGSSNRRLFESEVVLLEAMILLCDYAEAIKGKLYIMGGGWTVCPPGPRQMAIAVRVMVPWSEANTTHRMSLMLQDESGNTLELGDPPKPVAQGGTFEVGRPPGIPAGSEIDFTVVFNFVGLPLVPDRGYRWQLEINDEPSGHASFRTRA